MAPQGFVSRPKPRSTAEAVSMHGHDRLVSIAKNALHRYIESFLATTGFNRSFVEAISPQALQYVVDRSLQNNPDPQYKPTQLARMFNEIRQALPSILIIDSGVDWEETGFGGGLERQTNLNGNWQGWYRVAARVSVVVAAVTQDPESCSQLQNVLVLLFRQARQLAGGSRLVSSNPADRWEVRLPLTFGASLNQATNVADDPKDQVWASTIEMDLAAEDLVVIERPVQRVELDGGIVGQTHLRDGMPPVITAPQQVRLRDGPFMVLVSRLGMHHKIAIDTPRVATIDLDARVVTPHRLGSFRIVVNDWSRSNQNPEAPWANREVSSATVTVVP